MRIFPISYSSDCVLAGGTPLYTSFKAAKPFASSLNAAECLQKTVLSLKTGVISIRKRPLYHLWSILRCSRAFSDCSTLCEGLHCAIVFVKTRLVLAVRAAAQHSVQVTVSGPPPPALLQRPPARSSALRRRPQQQPAPAAETAPAARSGNQELRLLFPHSFSLHAS